MLKETDKVSERSRKSEGERARDKYNICFWCEKKGRWEIKCCERGERLREEKDCTERESYERRKREVKRKRKDREKIEKGQRE